VLDSCGLLRLGYIAKREHFRNTSLILPKTRKSIRRQRAVLVFGFVTFSNASGHCALGAMQGECDDGVMMLTQLLRNSTW